MVRMIALVLLVGACERADAEREAPPVKGAEEAAVRFAQPPPPAPPAKTPPRATTKVELVAVTLADDCGARRQDTASRARGAMARRCEQTSMQLGIDAGDAATIRVKSVDLLDEAGRPLDRLVASTPTRWNASSGTYVAWDEQVTRGSAHSVSYLLSQPRWGQIGNRWNRTFTLHVVMSIDGVDQTARKEVTLSAPTALPPNVRT